MRDDLTGFALGGNKVRKLDFLIGDALAKHADTLVVSGASSFSRNAAAAGKVFGLDVVVLVSGDEDDQNRISQAFFEEFDAQVRFLPDDAATGTAQAQLRDELTDQGRRVYELHPGGSDAIGTLGYVEAFGQICDVTDHAGVHFDRIVHASGSAATQAGLAVGSAISGYVSDLVGIAISQPESVQRHRVQNLAAETTDMLGVVVDTEGITVDDRFLGEKQLLRSLRPRKGFSSTRSTEGRRQQQSLHMPRTPHRVSPARSSSIPAETQASTTDQDRTGGTHYRMI
jgi:1-aminocyclopropane-1-carboxylate deaminase/D-cysteine desulfhydrase-like pyridoxal-dependent ACC family enzyme